MTINQTYIYHTRQMNTEIWQDVQFLYYCIWYDRIIIVERMQRTGKMQVNHTVQKKHDAGQTCKKNLLIVSLESPSYGTRRATEDGDLRQLEKIIEESEYKLTKT